MIGQAVFTGFFGPGKYVNDLTIDGIESITFDLARNVLAVTKDGRTHYFGTDDMKQVLVQKTSDNIMFFVTNEE